MSEFVEETKRRIAIEKARNMRFKKPMLSTMGWYEIDEGLNNIEEECSNVHYWWDDDESLVSAFDGEEDEAWEFKMAFADLECSAVQLREALDSVSEFDDDFEDYFNTCTVALIGNRYDVVGFDTYEEDYMSMTGYEQDMATSEAGKKLMTKTKKDILAQVGQCMGIILSYMDLKNKFDNLQGALEVLRGTNKGILDTIYEINSRYETEMDDHPYSTGTEWKKLLNALPEKIWVE